MKKTLLTIFGAVALATTSLGQANTQGSIIVDPYYGYPNFGKSLYESFESISSDYKARGIGPCGLRAEYMVGDKIGVGIDFIYNSNSTTYSTVDTTQLYNAETQTFTNEYTEYSFKRTMQRIRVQARINFHFDISNPNLDGYFGVGVGSNNRIRKYYENGTEITDEVTESVGKFTVLPFSMRICTGLRYYFTPNIGLNMELGLGGPMISAGASIRF